MEETPGSEKFFPAQLVFLALGFLGPEAEVLKSIGLKQDARSNIQTPPNVSVMQSRTIPARMLTESCRNTRRALRACSPPVTAVVASRSLCGASRRVAVAPQRSTPT